MSIYSTIAVIALFAIVAQHGARFHYAINAAFVVGGALLLSTVEYSIVSGFDVAMAQFAQMNQIVTILAQYAAALFVFRGIQNTSDSDLQSYFIWVATGWPIIFLLVPFIVGKVF